MRKVVTIAAFFAVATIAVRAQDPAAGKYVAEYAAVVQDKIQNMRVSVEGRVTKNAPYSAEAVTESVQLLADGNRITTKNATRIFRDNEGRTRREQLNAAGTDATTINISDPVAGNTFVLDPATHMAFRNNVVFATVGDSVGGMTVSRVGRGGTVTEMVRTPEAGAATAAREKEAREAAEAGMVEAKQVAEIKARVASTVAAAGAAGAGGVTTFTMATPLQRMAEGAGKTTREELGQQTIEGVTATGTRTTTEIPAGAIGNEQPIKIVSEQWYSPELQVLVLTKHSDPRAGETTYRLTNIKRGEPPAELFQKKK